MIALEMLLVIFALAVLVLPAAAPHFGQVFRDTLRRSSLRFGVVLVVSGYMGYAARTQEINYGRASAVVAAVALGAMAWSLIDRRGGTWKVYHRRSLAIAVGLFVSVEVAAAVRWGQISFGSVGAASMVAVLSGPVLVLGLLKRAPSRAELARSVRWWFFAVCGGSLLLAAASPATSFEGLSRFRFGLGDGLGRLAGLSTHPNSLGIAAIALLLCGLASSGYVRLLLLGVASLTVILTEQRAALISLVLVLVGWNLGRLSTFGQRLSAAVVVLSLGLWTSQTRIPSIAGQELGGQATVESREEVWAVVPSHAGDIWLWGWGPSGLYERSQSLGLNEAYFHAHNFLLDSFISGGAIMALVAIGILAIVIGSLVGSLRHGDPLGIASGLALIPLLTVETPTHTGLAPLLLTSSLSAWFLVVLSAGFRSCSPVRTFVRQDVEAS